MKQEPGRRPDVDVESGDREFALEWTNDRLRQQGSHQNHRMTRMQPVHNRRPTSAQPLLRWVRCHRPVVASPRWSSSRRWPKISIYQAVGGIGRIHRLTALEGADDGAHRRQ